MVTVGVVAVVQFHLYSVFPTVVVAKSFIDNPLQIGEIENSGVMKAIGNGNTATVLVAEQAALLTVTVYVPVVLGIFATVELLLHLKL